MSDDRIGKFLRQCAQSKDLNRTRSFSAQELFDWEEMIAGEVEMDIAERSSEYSVAQQRLEESPDLARVEIRLRGAAGQFIGELLVDGGSVGQVFTDSFETALGEIAIVARKCGVLNIADEEEDDGDEGDEGDEGDGEEVIGPPDLRDRFSTAKRLILQHVLEEGESNLYAYVEDAEAFKKWEPERQQTSKRYPPVVLRRECDLGQPAYRSSNWYIVFEQTPTFGDVLPLPKGARVLTRAEAEVIAAAEGPEAQDTGGVLDFPTVLQVTQALAVGHGEDGFTREDQKAALQEVCGWAMTAVLFDELCAGKLALEWDTDERDLRVSLVVPPSKDDTREAS